MSAPTVAPSGTTPETLPPGRLFLPTFEEYLAWALRQEEKTEWVDGEVIFVRRTPEGEFVPTRLIHPFLSSLLFLLIQNWMRRRGDGGLLLYAPVLLRLPNRPRGREPDLLYLAAEHRDRAHDTYIDAPADLVVEIASPESIDRDRDDKFFEYEAAGIPEYWLIDPETRGALLFRLAENGRYIRVAPAADGALVSEVLPGFALLPAWLWQATVPTIAEVEAFWEGR